MERPIYYYEEITSTNTEAKRLAEEGAIHGSLVVAKTQTAGKGRRGRQWNSQKGAGLYFSIILKPEIHPENASMLTLVAAMAVKEAVERMTGIHPEIKWPNDIILSGKKVCGILTEMSIQAGSVHHIVVGIGINVKKQDFPKEIVKVATSLEEVCGAVVPSEQLLDLILEEFDHYYMLYLKTMDLSLIQAEYNACLINRNRQVKVLDPQGAYEGIARGVNNRGELQVEYDGEVIAVNSGEVSVRGVYGYI